MILVKVKLVMEVVVVLKMVLMEVDHAMNVEGNREAAKLANWFTKRSVMTSSVTSLSTLLASFSTTLSINWSITIPNTTSPHLRCHKNSQAIWRSSVGLPGSPVVFMSLKSVFSETPCISSWRIEFSFLEMLSKVKILKKKFSFSSQNSRF